MSRSMESTTMPVSRRRLLWVGTSLPALIMAGCQLPGSGPPPREFRVTHKTTFPEDLPAVEWSLVVGGPAGAPESAKPPNWRGSRGGIK